MSRPRLKRSAIRLLERVDRMGGSAMVSTLLSTALRLDDRQRHGRWVRQREHERQLSRFLTPEQRQARAAQAADFRRFDRRLQVERRWAEEP